MTEFATANGHFTRRLKLPEVKNRKLLPPMVIRTSPQGTTSCIMLKDSNNVLQRLPHHGYRPSPKKSFPAKKRLLPETGVQYQLNYPNAKTRTKLHNRSNFGTSVTIGDRFLKVPSTNSSDLITLKNSPYLNYSKHGYRVKPLVSKDVYVEGCANLQPHKVPKDECQFPRIPRTLPQVPLLKSEHLPITEADRITPFTRLKKIFTYPLEFYERSFSKLTEFV